MLPYSTKFLIDSVIAKHHVELLRRLVLVVLTATIIQGITSFSLTQLLSKAAQRLIAELARKYKFTSRICRFRSTTPKNGHPGLDNRPTWKVSEIYWVQAWLIWLEEYLLRHAMVFSSGSPVMTLLAFSFLLCFAIALNKAFTTIRPIFRQRGKINAEVTGGSLNRSAAFG